VYLALAALVEAGGGEAGRALAAAEAELAALAPDAKGKARARPGYPNPNQTPGCDLAAGGTTAHAGAKAEAARAIEARPRLARRRRARRRAASPRYRACLADGGAFRGDAETSEVLYNTTACLHARSAIISIAAM